MTFFCLLKETSCVLHFFFQLGNCCFSACLMCFHCNCYGQSWFYDSFCSTQVPLLVSQPHWRTYRPTHFLVQMSRAETNKNVQLFGHYRGDVGSSDHLCVQELFWRLALFLVESYMTQHPSILLVETQSSCVQSPGDLVQFPFTIHLVWQLLILWVQSPRFCLNLQHNLGKSLSFIRNASWSLLVFQGEHDALVMFYFCCFLAGWTHVSCQLGPMFCVTF